MELSKDKAKELLDRFALELKKNGINVENGLFYVNYEYGQYVRIMQYIAQDWPGQQEQLVELLAKGMPEQYAVLVHAVKSNAELLGAADLKETALQLESMCKKRQLEGWQEADARLQLMMDSVEACLSVVLSYINQINQEGKGYLTETMHDDYQDKLLQLVEAASAWEADQLLHRILEHQMEQSQRQKYEEVEKRIYQCEYDEAKSILKERF